MNLKQILGFIAFAAIIGLAAIPPASAQSQYTTGTTAGDLIWGPLDGVSQVTALEATSDKAGSSVKIYVRAAEPAAYKITRQCVTSNVFISATNGLAVGDVVIASGNGITPYKATISVIPSVTNLYLSAIPSTLLTNGCILNEVVKVYAIPVGSASVSRASGPIVVTPTKSPVWISLDGTATNELSATVK